MEMENKAYTTNDELNFIYRLGTFSSKTGLDRFTLIKRYKNACMKRQVWNDIDSKETTKHLKQLTA